MSVVVDNWANKKDSYWGENGKPLSQQTFCNLHGILLKTFRKYATGKKKNRRVVGCKVGKPASLVKDEMDFVGNIIVRADRGNEGKNRAEAVDLIQELKPDITRA